MLETQADKSVVASLAQFRWESRVIVIFPDKDNARTARQENQLMADRPGLEERDVVVLKVAGDTVRPLFGAVEDLDAKALARDLAASPPGEFMAFLVGKDGTVKLTLGEPISAAELFTIIDAMPMRSAEAARR
ncbi:MULTISPECIES: DUF4174 domain-containing protein [unclassified Rhizobium]|uniref:DUF4174 domain-containing protein n=1 Tax=unclassified Rhizobium TaxID=2613769 RepID=UPI001ADC47FC|nr:MULTISPECIES: DUF4174 domain-containing protein [unclassified Rhizobium]MBO9122754.1 DUF4174 domain-containing protein [Rhizobium sp. 16-488-2b]MBO9173286.1 DUF4174 domain-containing protein [Rhizobium sp. 16-488-2a]